jgi:hypothetical protein
MPIDLAKQPTLASIQESDLDLLLMIALNGSETFRNAFIGKATGETSTKFKKAWRGLADYTGETDVTVLYTGADGSRAAILIEDKIDAQFQKDQAKRCRARGELGVTNGDWTRFKTCLCAPEVYAKPYAEGPDWDRVVSIEVVVAMLAQCADEYAPFLTEAIRRAVIKYDNGGFVENLAASEFWKRYRQLCLEEFPDLALSAFSERQTAAGPWPGFAADRLHHRLRLEHKPMSNCVDLTLKDFKYQQVLDRLSGRLPDGFAIKSTPPSSAIRIEAPHIVATEPFDDQIDAVRGILKAARRLLLLWPKVRPLLDFPEPIEEDEILPLAPVVTPKLDLSLSALPRGGWQTGDWTDRQKLKALAKYDTVFTNPDFEFGRWPRIPSDPYQGQSITFEIAPEITQFQKDLYDYGWVLDTEWNWPEWAKTEEAQALFEDGAALSKGTIEQLQHVLTVRLRIARVQEKTVLVEDFRSGLFLRIVRRAAVILAENS